MNLREQVKALDRDQMASLRSYIGELIAEKDHEEKRVVWRVCSGGVCYGNFRTEDYAGAVACLADLGARKLLEGMVDGRIRYSTRDLEIRIVSEETPASEYESWFD